MRPPPVTLLLAAFVLLAPTVDAHARYTTPDGRVNLIIGSLNEPITTYTKSGLDLSVTDAAGHAILDVQNTLTATLVAPDNATPMTDRLTTQFGKTGSYTFAKPYTLTEPGQYRLRLVGSINGTAMDGTYNVAGPVESLEATAFPDDVQTLATLTEGRAADQARISLLEGRIAALESGGAANKPAPSLAPLVALLLALGLAATLRRS